MIVKFTPLNAFRLFVIICLLTSAVILPANGASAVQAQPLFFEETPTDNSGSNDELTPTSEVTETPVPEVTEDLTQTPEPEITEEVTPTPEPEVTEEVTETPTPEEVTETPVPDEQITEEPPVEVVDGQSAEVCASLPDGNSKTECEALVALYQSTNGAGWLRKTSWLTTTPHCEWYGITCHDSGHVKEIQLSPNRLTGTLPSQIGNFPQLKTLNVQNNAIGGLIPNEIGNLESLEVLYLSFNSFGGSIPTTIGQLKNLKRVELSRNKLTGPIPEDIGGMTGLEHIWGFDNQLSGPIPSTINNLTKLTTFHFSNNQLSGSLPDLPAVSNLTDLRLANNELMGNIPSSISKKGSLGTLNLSNNKLEGNLSNFASLTNVKVLNLSGNQLTGPIPASFGEFTNLTYLNLGNNPLGGTIPSQLGNLTNLKELYLNSNELSGKSWPAWLNSMTQLERLNLSNNFEMGGPIPPEIGNFVNLRLLDISHNHFWGEIPLEITKLTKLNVKVNSSDPRVYTDIGHNHLTSKNTKVRDFLSKKDPDWEKTQTPANPIPVIQSLNPPYVIIGTSTMVLQVRGKSMMDGAVVYLNGDPKSTTFVNNFTLEIEVPGELMATENVLEITAKNPWPSINESAVYKFYVSDLMPAVGSTVLSRRPSFLWYTVSGADLYEFQISTYKNFSQSVTKLTSNTNSLTVTKDLPLNKMMYWRVRGKVGGVYQAWSEVYYFRSSSSPGVAALSSPANKALTTNYVPKLVWKIPSISSGTVFEKYQVQVASDPAFALGTTVVDEILTIRSKPTYTIPSGVLQPNTQYYWRVRTFNTLAHESNWSTSRIIRSAMLPPVLSEPGLGDTALTPRPLMKWEAVDGATSYQIQFSTSSTFGTLLQSGKPSGTEFTPTKNLPQNKTIHWRVRAVGPNGPSLWTKSSFRSANPPSTPSLSSPANNALLTDPAYTPTLKWGVSSLPSGTTFKHYIVQISKFKDFPDGDTVQYPAITVRTQNTLQVGPLDPNTRYYWRVHSENMANQYSTWSSVRSFRAAMLPVASLDKPVQDSIAESPRPSFEWSPVDGAKSYTIQLSLKSNFSTLIRSNVVNTTSFIPPADLVRKKTIYWRVRANGDNGPTLWIPGSFTSANAPSTPSLLGPSNGTLITANQAMLKWSASSVPSGTIFKHYQIDIATNDTFSENLASYTTTDLFYSLNLQPNTRYYWRVQGWNENGQYSTWSAVRNFRSAMTAPQGLAIQTGTEKTRRPTFTWDAVPGATSYTIQLSLYANFSSMVTSGKPTGTTYSPSISLPQNKIVYWRVRAEGANGPSLWSTPQSFTSANPPSTPSLVSPANGAVLKTLQKLDWSNSIIPAGTTFSHYQVEVASDTAFSIKAIDKVTNVSEWNDWASVSPLTAKTRYYWRVRAVNTEGHISNWSSRRYFTSP
jgi:Leucine-rich repeat (LRR) protein